MSTTHAMEGIDETPASQQSRPPLNVVYEWLTTVDHKKIGLMYIAYALAFLLIAGVEAILMRIQLAVPNNHFVPPRVFNRLFTMHGTTMIFFVGMPILFGFGNYLVPLMIGARDMAFPRLNAFSFWVSAFAGLLLYFSFVGASGLYAAGSAPDVGWFAYAPLTSRVFSPGHSTDYWTLAIFLSGIGSIGTALNIVATTICMRCKGMKMSRMPLLVWLYLVTASMVFIAISPLTAAQIMLSLDRYIGSHFFDTQAGGSAVLWMHFFWIFGHPEVYILVLPAFAFVNEIVPVFSRKAIFGYPAMVAASVSIGFISRGTPGMQATNLPSGRNAIKPGAVPFGFGITCARDGRIACRRLFSLIGRFNFRKRSSSARSEGSCSTSLSATAVATASFVRSSTVGPRPPVVMTPSARSNASASITASRSVLSPTECLA